MVAGAEVVGVAGTEVVGAVGTEVVDAGAAAEVAAAVEGAVTGAALFGPVGADEAGAAEVEGATVEASAEGVAEPGGLVGAASFGAAAEVPAAERDELRSACGVVSPFNESAVTTATAATTAAAIPTVAALFAHNLFPAACRVAKHAGGSCGMGVVRCEQFQIAGGRGRSNDERQQSQLQRLVDMRDFAIARSAVAALFEMGVKHHAIPAGQSIPSTRAESLDRPAAIGILAVQHMRLEVRLPQSFACAICQRRDGVRRDTEQRCDVGRRHPFNFGVPQHHAPTFWQRGIRISDNRPLRARTEIDFGTQHVGGNDPVNVLDDIDPLVLAGTVVGNISNRRE